MTIEDITAYLIDLHERADQAEDQAATYRSAVESFLARMAHARSDGEVLILVTALKRETGL